MLSRVANHLYWLGRYLERTDHLSRYINIEYFSSLDNPDQEKHIIALKSIIDMSGMTPVNDNELNEENILVSAALDEKNQVSIVSSLFACRENARGVRESISTELWEAVNSFYHYVANYPIDVLKTKGLHDFTTNVMQHCSNVRGRINYTLLHDVGWSFIQMGLLIERSAQIVRIIISKVKDIDELKKNKLGSMSESQQWNILLDCVEAKDMCRKHYSTWPDRKTAIDFLLFNLHFPKSVIFNLKELKKCLEEIQHDSNNNKQGIGFKVGKILSSLEYMQVEEVENNLGEFLEETLIKIYLINDLIVEEYFN